jgi:hypothetical protein
MMTRRVVVVPDAARRPAWRPPALRPPPPPLGVKELGQTGFSVNWSNIGQTIMFGAFGAGAMYAAPLLPDPMKTIAMVGGVGLIGYGAYTFLGSASKPESEVPTGTSSPIPLAKDFEAITGQILQPKAGSRNGFNLLSDTYPVKVLVSNPNPRPVTVTLQLVVREQPYVFILIPARTEDYVADVRTVTIPAGSSLTIDMRPETKTSRWVASLEMSLTLRKIRAGGDSQDLDHVAFELQG